MFSRKVAMSIVEIEYRQGHLFQLVLAIKPLGGIGNSLLGAWLWRLGWGLCSSCWLCGVWRRELRRSNDRESPASRNDETCQGDCCSQFQLGCGHGF